MDNPRYDLILGRLTNIYKTIQSDENITKAAQKITTLLDDFTAQESIDILENWSEKTALLITYGDTICYQNKTPLQSLHQFYKQRLKNIIDTVHILPFCPSTSDDGFAVQDYKQVAPELGDWSDIAAFAQDANMMADMVMNHGSASSQWFQDFKDGKSPETEFFFVPDQEFDTSNVVRPRSSPLLQTVETKDGTKDIWCTFSFDQIDYNFKSLDLLIEFIEIFLFYIKQGVSVFRLDAVAFIWKETGTKCVNLRETHEIIRLFRFILESVAPECIIITETNLPSQENLSYFGNGNEAHWVYNFSLPPMILYTLLFGNSTPMRRWAMGMPPAIEGTTYLNFIASHDGIGMRPAEGLLSDKQLSRLLGRLKKNGSAFTERSLPDGSTKVYEANVTLYSALKKTIDDPQGIYATERFIAAHTIMCALEGVPAFYFHSLFGVENDTKALEESGINRRINRSKWSDQQQDQESFLTAEHGADVFERLTDMLLIRQHQPAFSPSATQFTLQLGSKLFGLWRQSRDRRQSIFAITNTSNKRQKLNLHDLNLIGATKWVDLLSGDVYADLMARIYLEPYQTIWLSNKRG